MRFPFLKKIEGSWIQELYEHFKNLWQRESQESMRKAMVIRGSIPKPAVGRHEGLNRFIMSTNERQTKPQKTQQRPNVVKDDHTPCAICCCEDYEDDNLIVYCEGCGLCAH